MYKYFLTLCRCWPLQYHLKTFAFLCFFEMDKYNGDWYCGWRWSRGSVDRMFPHLSLEVWNYLLEARNSLEKPLEIRNLIYKSTADDQPLNCYLSRLIFYTHILWPISWYSAVNCKGRHCVGMLNRSSHVGELCGRERRGIQGYARRQLTKLARSVKE